MNNRWLTLITVTKDDAVGLARTLKSANALRTAGAEHLVVDGGTDGSVTKEVVSRVAGDVVVHERSPQGIADAFNFGLSAARGEWVWFLNGGDAVHEALETAWFFSLLSMTSADVITGGLHYDGDASPRLLPPLACQWPLFNCWLAHPATLVRRERLLAFGGFNRELKIAMDYDLWQRLLRGATVDVLSVPFARFDVHGISQCSDSRARVCREEATVLLGNSLVLLGAVSRPFGIFLRRMIWAFVHWRPFAHAKK
jgi:hypothetical protein